MAVSALRWFKAALLLQVLLLAYWLTMEVIDLFPWNDLASFPGDYDLRRRIAVNALQQLAYIGLFALGLRLFALLAVLGYAFYFAMQLKTWWVPYAFGADAAWRARYAQVYGKTLKLLPSEGVHLAPDVQHLAMHVLTLAVLIASAMALARMRHL
jgi:hypothetical protein